MHNPLVPAGLRFLAALACELVARLGDAGENASLHAISHAFVGILNSDPHLVLGDVASPARGDR
jgi:hypothetical protein